MSSKNFYIILLAVNSVLSDLEAPKLLSVALIDYGGLYILWEPVPNNDSNPVLGYKINMWEIKEHTDRMYKLVNANRQPGLVEQSAPEELFYQDVAPSRMPKLYQVIGADTNSISIDHVKKGILNEIRVHAFTKTREGPASAPWRVKLLSEVENGKGIIAVSHTNDPDTCMLAVPAKVDAAGESYPTAYNIYL